MHILKPYRWNWPAPDHADEFRKQIINMDAQDTQDIKFFDGDSAPDSVEYCDPEFYSYLLQGK